MTLTATSASCCRLNPFFIRSAVEIIRGGRNHTGERLNPFFIRSAVEMLLQDLVRQQVDVLIPSSSGLRLKLQ